MARSKKSIVIDSDVASSASPSGNLRSESCYEVLEKILEHKFSVVFTDDLLEEWSNHQSRYFSRWLTEVFGRKLQVPLKDADVVDEKLRADIVSHAKSEKDREEMLKDVHLLEAALASDETIISMNETDRSRFMLICENIAKIKTIIWVNPEKSDEGCLDWLDNDAPADDFRQLGYRGDD